MINEVVDTKPELYETFITKAVFSDEGATMNSATATMNDFVVTMGGSDPLNQDEAPEVSLGLIEDITP